MHCRWRTVQKSFEWAHTEKGACPRDRWYAVNNKSRNSLVHSHSYFGPWESTVTPLPPLPHRMTCMPSTVQVLVQHLPLFFFFCPFTPFSIHNSYSFIHHFVQHGRGEEGGVKYEAKVAQQRNEKKSCIKYAQKGLSGCTHVPRTHSTYGRHQAEKAQWFDP